MEASTIWITISSVVTGASIICKGLEILARVITPKYQGDDIAISKIQKFISTTQSILSIPAINTKEKKKDE